MLPAASILYIVNNKSKTKIYLKSCYSALLFYILPILVFSVLQVGRKATYGYTKLVYIGGLEMLNLYPIIYLVIFIIALSIYSIISKDVLFFQRKNPNIFWISISVLFLSIIFLIAKRDYILLPILGIFIFSSIYNRFSLGKNFVLLSFGITIFIFFMSFGYTDILKNQFIANRGGVDLEIYKEGRYLEYEDYIFRLQRYDETLFVLIGEEIFNSRGKFFQNSRILFDRDRVLHSDITHFLYGIGIIGLSVFFILLFKLYRLARVAYRTNLKSDRKLFLWSTFVSIFIVMFAHNFTGGLFYLSGKVIQWQMMGILIGLLISNTDAEANSKKNIIFDRNCIKKDFKL
jgi:hypothetical protein